MAAIEQTALPAYTNDELALLILPWAKEHRPDAYAATVAVAARAKSFRSYLARLIELRYEAEPEWRNTVSLRALEATSLAIDVTRTTGEHAGVTLTIAGERVPNRQWSFGELAALTAAAASTHDFDTLIAAKLVFDLELVPAPETRT